MWSRRQKQWILARPAPIEGVERMNAEIMCSDQKAGFTQYNSYAIDVDRGNRNCYNYGGFGHIARNCRNREMREREGKGKRLEYGQMLMIEGNNRQSNLNRRGDLVVLD